MPLITLLKLGFPQQWEICTNGIFGNASCWPSSLCPSTGHGKAVTGGLEFQKFQINIFPPKAPSSFVVRIQLSLSCYFLLFHYRKRLSVTSLPSMQLRACGMRAMKREAISPVTHQALLSAKGLPVVPHSLFSIISSVPSRFKAQNCLLTRDKLESKC